MSNTGTFIRVQEYEKRNSIHTNYIVTPQIKNQPDVSHRMETALLLRLWLVHGVLKWLHHPALKYVMLWHSNESSHDFLHSSMLGSFPGDFVMYFSPALVSHSILEPISDHMPRFLVAAKAKQ